MRTLLRAGLALAALALPVTPAAPQSGDEQARRLLEDGRQYWVKGQYKQALDNFNTIVSGFSNTDSVDDALLEIGRYYMEVEVAPERAREQFSEVVKRYPQSDGAPGAYYYLGRLTLEHAVTAPEMDDALAQFDRLRTLYPRSEWVPAALHASGQVHRKAGRLPEALEFERRAVLEYPTSPAAAAAQFQIGHCLTLAGEYRQAMEEFQQVRNRYPESEWAVRALDRTTALYRLYGGQAPSFGLDRAFSVGSGDVLKDVRALAFGPAGSLWIGSEKTRSVIPFDAQGKPGPSVSAEDLRSLSVTPQNALVVAVRLAVRLGTRDVKTFAAPSEKGLPEVLEGITAALVTPGGSLLVADEQKERVFRYDGKYQYSGTFPDARPRKVVRMALDGEGAVVMLDRDEKSVRVYDETGRLLRSVGGRTGGLELRKPVDVAVDPARNLYVADEEAGVLVISPQGKLLASLAGETLRRAKAIALEPNGAILVYDEKAERVLRFR